MSTDENLLRETIFALQELMRMFAIERILYLVCTIVSFAILVVILFSLFVTENVSWLQVTLVFSSSGLIAASAGRVSFFLNKAVDVISAVATGLASGKSV